MKKHKLVSKINRLSFGMKFILISLLAIIFLTSGSVVLGMRGINVVSLIMQYDENGNSKWFTPKPTAVPFEIKPYTADAIIELINEKRIDEGLDALNKDKLLTKAADQRSEDMMKRNYFDYKDPNGNEWWVPIENEDYIYENAYPLIENGYIFATDVINNWFSSDEIKKNILDKKFKDIGVSVKTGNYQGTNSTLVVVYFANKQINTAGNTRTAPTVPPLIDCILHTGRLIQADKKTCDDFKTRKYDPYETTSKNSNPSKQYILDNAKNTANYLGRQDCLQLANMKVNRCSDSCLSTYEEDLAICKIVRDNGAWETDRFDECRSDIDSKYNTCSDECTNTMNSEFKQCEQKFPL